MVAGQFLNLAPPRGHAQQQAHRVLGNVHRLSDIADARRPVRLGVEFAKESRREPLFFGGKIHHVMRAAHPHTVEGYFAAFRQLFECGLEQGAGDRQAQRLARCSRPMPGSSGFAAWNASSLSASSFENRCHSSSRIAMLPGPSSTLTGPGFEAGLAAAFLAGARLREG